MTDLYISCFELLHGRQDPVFRDYVYVPAGTGLLLISLLVALVFYYVVNGFRARFNRTRPHWFVAALVAVSLNILLLGVIEKQAPDLRLSSPASLNLFLIDALYAAIAFFCVSVLVKWFSPHARHTPF